MLSNVNSTSTPFLLHPVEGNANPEAPPPPPLPPPPPAYTV